ncbi:ABC transporter substrate-binding protein [Paenibacillus oceani]|uniref:Extracellular solute-binding protein n=1 Tax=Paenibacillus oceani TaxID=2772510 RepID=A0A927C7P6_9BACL|nr:extracellular solute-binding protein [Paenibacillus oceani]MBD2861562.1 extracellular solute-binding protein [Paenibacillus oceani]
MLKKNAVWFTASITVVSMLTGCAGNGNESAAKPPAEEQVKPVPQEPITLKIASARTKENFEQYIRPVKEKYPNVTLQQMSQYKFNAEVIQSMVAAGDIPDIIDEALTNTPLLLELDLPMDLEPLVKKLKVDMASIDESVLKSVRSYTDNGRLFYMPTNLNPPMVLFYNKDIFDKFGVPYPKDNSTWEELIELAQKVTRTENGVNYRGLTAGTALNRTQTQLSLPFVDRATGKSLVGTNPGWKKLFETWKAIYDIPGNYPQGAHFGKGVDDFLKTKNLAMFPHFLFLAEDAAFAEAVKGGLNWGVTTFPVFKDNPGVGVGGIAGGFMITKASKNPEVAFQVMMALLSDEGQTLLSKQGDITSVTKPEIRGKIFENSTVVKPLVPKETLANILKIQEPAPYARTKHDAVATTIATNYLTQYFTGKLDLNTALRKADEDINKKIEEEGKK